MRLWLNRHSWFEVIFIGGFLMSWAPYASLSMAKSFMQNVKIMPFTSICVALLAKSSLLWTTLFYILTNTKILRKYHRRSRLNNGAVAAATSLSQTQSVSKSNEYGTITKSMGGSFKTENYWKNFLILIILFIPPHFPICWIKEQFSWKLVETSLSLSQSVIWRLVFKSGDVIENRSAHFSAPKSLKK